MRLPLGAGVETPNLNFLIPLLVVLAVPAVFAVLCDVSQASWR